MALAMTNSIRIGNADPADYDDLGAVMYEAIHHGRSVYTRAQRLAWCPKSRAGSEWAKRLSSQTVYVAHRQNQTLGFMSLADAGYVDFAYIRPAAQGSGLFRRLYRSIEQHAVETQQRRLWVHASLTAQPAFSAMGFAIIKREVVEIGDQSLLRFEMEKHPQWDS